MNEQAARYDRVAMSLHWAIGIALLAQIVFGFLLDELAPRGTPARGPVINLHKSIGLVLLVLVVARLAWRLTHQPPRWPDHLRPAAKRAADWGHRALYLCMVALPVSGYIASNFSKHGVKFFGIAMPPWGADLPGVYAFFNGLHVALAWGFTALVLGHVGVALMHLAVWRDGLFQRMWPATLAVGLALLAGPAQAAPFAYVPNEGSGTLSVIDVATDQVVAEIAAGKKPRGTVITVDGQRAFVSDQPNNRLVIVDLAKRQASGEVALGESPEGVGLSPDGRWAAVAIEESNDVAFVDTASNKLAYVVKVSGKNPEHAVFSPDGKLVFVSAEEGEAVNVIDMAKRQDVARIPVGARPRGIGFSPDGARAYVAAENSDELYVIYTRELKVAAKVKAGSRSNGVTVHPNGKWVFVSNGGAASVSVIDAATLATVATVPVGQRPWNMALSPDGAKLYVACGRSGSVVVVDAQKHVKLAEITVGKLPWGVAIR
ncbi:cytochrome b/b6 domain-containing protein [Ideonella sp. DXS29W]|uniref:Cytochrome b/b6 domain-containing protein n=1 Tax=Ideonella lacteola TaxID=2984193 RepID=A0ABU9BML7_9BURK